MNDWPRSRVGQYARRVGELMELEEDTLGMLEVAGAMHDAGKDFLSDRILDKPGPLDEAEWEAMRRHPELGAAVAKSEGHPDDVADWVQHSHERMDGTGYPDHLEGDEIPMGARIIAVLDAYVGMTSPRPYRTPLPPEEALQELERAAGSHFDAEVVSVFVRLVRANLANL